VEVDLSEAEVRAYRLGHYEDALALLRNRVESDPEAMQVLYSLIWLCERVIATVPDDSDMEHFAVQREWNRASSARRVWLRLRGRAPGDHVRCKWCGHFAEYRNPNLPGYDNRCSRCRAMFPAPHSYWDSPAGMAEAAGRSWEANSVNDQVWNEFFDCAVAEGLITESPD
jgi:hypothetical protein